MERVGQKDVNEGCAWCFQTGQVGVVEGFSRWEKRVVLCGVI